MSQKLPIAPDVLHCFVQDPNKAWLIVTEDCHLCEQAVDSYKMASSLGGLPDLEVIELMDHEELHALAHHIPVLILPKRILSFPFSVMDILASLS